MMDICGLNQLETVLGAFGRCTSQQEPRSRTIQEWIACTKMLTTLR